MFFFWWLTGKERIKNRGKHPTLNGPEADAVVDEFAKGLQPPQAREGFAFVHTIRSDSDVNALCKDLLQRSTSASSASSTKTKPKKR